MALSTEALFAIGLASFVGIILFVWFMASWTFRGAIIAAASPNYFDMNVNEIGDIDFKIGKINPAGFIIVNGLPKKIKDKSAVMLGRAKGVITYSTLAMSLRPKELAAISSLGRKDRKDLTYLMNRKIFFNTELFDGDKDLKKELEKDIGGPLTPEEEGTLKAILDQEVLINEFESIRMADVISGLNDTPSAIEMQNYADEEVREAMAETKKFQWEKYIIPIAILIVVAAMGKLIMTPSFEGMIPKEACDALLAAKVTPDQTINM